MPALMQRLGLLGPFVLILAGCGQNSPTEQTAAPQPAAATEATTTAMSPASAQTEMIGATATGTEQEAAESAADEPPAQGTARWHLAEIERIRLLPLPAIEAASSDEGEGVVGASATTAAEKQGPTIKEQIAATRQIRRERNQQIAALAMTTIAQTAKDPAQKAEFEAAVGHLLDARLQLALQGDEESIAALYEAAEAFYAKMPDSPIAAEAELTLVNLAQANAMRYASTEPRWLQELSRHAQLFATRFPGQKERALPQLLSAGRSCELHGMVDEARSCLSLIQNKFPDSPQAEQSAGILRRLGLVGQTLEFAGPTLDGNYINIEEHRGQTVVIVFWASHAKPFTNKVETLKALTDKYRKYIQVMSVCLDAEEAPVDKFLEQTGLNWPVIFNVEDGKRGWSAPLAVHYGVTSLPAIWIVDPKGTVVETQLTAETLEPKLREVILKHRQSTASAPATTPAPN